jgi:hypothetical protein
VVTVTTDDKEIILLSLHSPFQNDWGFIEWEVFECGNGDYFGFYWKIGAEDQNPIVCALHHDDWELMPWASSLERFFRIATANEVHKITPFAENFWVNKEELQEILEGLNHQDIYDNCFTVRTLEDILTIDNHSPICLKYLGDQYREEKNISAAIEYYRRALFVLPEYGDASFALAKIYRSQRDQHLAIPHFIDAFTAPFYFSKDKDKILHLLKGYNDDSLYDMKDPLWKRRHLIKLDEEEKHPSFHHLLNEIIDEYIELKEFQRAIGLRLFLGNFAQSDERLSHRYQLSDHRKLLRKNLEDAGFNGRIRLLGL